MRRRLAREVALCLVLLVIVVSVSLYLNVFSLHENSAAAKIKLKSRLSVGFRDTLTASTPKKSSVIPASEELGPHVAKSNHSVKYNSDKSLLFNAGEVFTDDERGYARRQMSKHAFNVLISDRIGPVARPIPDTRHALCQKKTYSNISITASVIVCFHKEAFSALLRTVASIIERTPPQLLQEVILVDDFSGEGVDDISEYINQYYPYGKVRVVHTDARLGLIGARLLGAKEASGDALIFLDSHCEPNVGWIEPLLDIVQKDRKTVVCPVVDTISSDTMTYTSSPAVRGGFNWGLFFAWEDLPEKPNDPSEPFPSPTMAGGLFAVNRLYFKEIGYYDEEMKEWGGENLELSFRLWMCGGQLLIAPCSRAGHIFRPRRPNVIIGEDNPTRNAARLAAVWLDDFKKHFYRKRPSAVAMDYGDVTARVKLRKDLQCKSFQWYLDEVYPEIDIPDSRPSKIKHYRSHTAELQKDLKRGLIKVSGLDLCLQGDEDKGSLVTAQKCEPGSTSQTWRFTSIGELRLGTTSKLCIDASSGESPRLLKCTYEEGYQSWKFYPSVNGGSVDAMAGRLYNLAEGLCLQLSGGGLSDKYELIMQLCGSPSVQTFTIE